MYIVCTQCVKCGVHADLLVCLLRIYGYTVVTALYTPPQADTTTALEVLHCTLCKLETTYPEAAFTVAGDLKKQIWGKLYWSSINTLTVVLTLIKHSTSTTPTSRDANALPQKGRRKKKEKGSTRAEDYSTLVWPIGIHASRLFWSRGLGYVSENNIDKYTDDWVYPWQGDREYGRIYTV